MMKARPLAPMSLFPFRVETSPGTHITWHTDGFIEKVYSNGNIEVWVPLVCVSKEYMHQTVLPNAASHTTFYTTKDAANVTEGESINWHYIDLPDDSTSICWDNECTCFDDARIYKSKCDVANMHVGDIDNCDECFDQLCNMPAETGSRCETYNKHVGCPYCPVCGPEIEEDEEERRNRYIDESEEFADY